MREQENAERRRNLRWIVFWVLVSFLAGVVVGYCLFLARDYDAAERYRQHILQFHSERHQGV